MKQLGEEEAGIAQQRSGQGKQPAIAGQIGVAPEHGALPLPLEPQDGQDEVQQAYRRQKKGAAALLF